MLSTKPAEPKNDKAAHMVASWTLAAFPNHRCQSKKHLQPFKGLQFSDFNVPIYRSLHVTFSLKKAAQCARCIDWSNSTGLFKDLPPKHIQAGARGDMTTLPGFSKGAGPMQNLKS